MPYPPTATHIGRAVLLALALAALASACAAGSGSAGGGGQADARVTADGGSAAGPDATFDAVPPSDAADAHDDTSVDVWTGPWSCPDDMALVETAAVVVCVDRYEAARPDAEWYDAGTDERRAVSRPEVLPWVVGDDRATAAAACAAAGKRLCRPQEWQTACAGPDDRAYPYGDTYREDMCNGFETHGPGSFRLLPTGRMETCESGFGLFDMSGNLWELVEEDADLIPRGGAYDSTDAPYTHRCTYVRSGGRFASVGFRCCRDAEPLP